MDTLIEDLVVVELSCLWDCYFGTKALQKVAAYQLISGREEGEYVLDEVSLIVVQLLLPVFHVEL